MVLWHICWPHGRQAMKILQQCQSKGARNCCSFRNNDSTSFNMFKARRKICSAYSAAGITSKSNNFRQFIKDNTELTKDHLTPEIKLHLITKSCPLWNSREEECPVPDPFWAFYWPGGQALTRFLLENPKIVQDKEVLDVGSGCGASSIAAAMMDAKRVIANDICPVATAAIQLNAEINGVELSVSQDNLIGSVSNSWDVILLGDMFYDQLFTDQISQWIQSLDNKKQRTILIGDPGRVYFMNHPIKDTLQCVFKIKLPEVSREENNGLTHGYVWMHGNKSQH